jgi:hypothetical protein
MLDETKDRAQIGDGAQTGAPSPDPPEHEVRRPSLPAAAEAVAQEVSSWEGVTVHQHRFGGVEFRIGRRELGHLHGTIADLPFPRPIRDQLIAAGRARPHHVLPQSGWITVPMRTRAEVANVVALFRRNYERDWKAPARR